MPGAVVPGLITENLPRGVGVETLVGIPHPPGPPQSVRHPGTERKGAAPHEQLRSARVSEVIYLRVPRRLPAGQSGIRCTASRRQMTQRRLVEAVSVRRCTPLVVRGTGLSWRNGVPCRARFGVLIRAMAPSRESRLTPTGDRPQRRAAAPLPLLDASRLRCGSVCPRQIPQRGLHGLGRTPERVHADVVAAPEVIHSSAARTRRRHVHRPWRSTVGSAAGHSSHGRRWRPRAAGAALAGPRFR